MDTIAAWTRMRTVIVVTEFYGNLGSCYSKPSTYEFAIHEYPYIVLSELLLVPVSRLGRYLVVDPPTDRGYQHTDITKEYTALKKAVAPGSAL